MCVCDIGVSAPREGSIRDLGMGLGAWALLDQNIALLESVTRRSHPEPGLRVFQDFVQPDDLRFQPSELPPAEGLREEHDPHRTCKS